VTDDPHGTIAAAIMLAIAAAFIFESVKADRRKERSKCGCNHEFRRHVRKMDVDSEWYYPGNTLKVGQCRDCRCRSFIQR
jgi:hypothetical protein